MDGNTTERLQCGPDDSRDTQRPDTISFRYIFYRNVPYLVQKHILRFAFHVLENQRDGSLLIQSCADVRFLKTCS